VLNLPDEPVCEDSDDFEAEWILEELLRVPLLTVSSAVEVTFPFVVKELEIGWLTSEGSEL